VINATNVKTGAQGFIEGIQNEANRLSRLIDNILNISRIESGLVKINKQPQSLMVIMKEAIEIPMAAGARMGASIVELAKKALFARLSNTRAL